MRFLLATKYVFKNLRLAAALSPLIILLVILAEGTQHIVEYELGMYQSHAVFREFQSHPIRLTFGILKAVTFIAACYVIAKNMTVHLGPSPKFGSFRADMVRRLWDPRQDMTALPVSILLAAPLIFLHYKMSYLAIGHSMASLLLLLDSVLIGVLSLVVGTSLWAGDKAAHVYGEATSHELNQG